MTLAVHGAAGSATIPLVLLHAFPLDSTMWDPVLARLGDSPVLRVDAPGFGMSSVRQPGLDAVADELVDTLRERGHERAVVVGLSMGGYLALAIAQTAPEILAGIGLISTKSSADGEPARVRRLDMATAAERGEPDLAVGMLAGLLGETTHRTRPDVVEHVRATLAAAPLDGLVWAQRSMAARADRTGALQALPQGLPALVARGTEDALMTDDDARVMAQALGTEVTEIERAGHLVALERPDVVAGELRSLHERAR